MRRISTLLLSFILLTACGLSSKLIATPDITPMTATLTMTSVEPLRTSPSLTATSTITPVPSLVPTKTLIPSPIQDQPSQELSSPDGKLIAKMYESYWHTFSAQVIEIEDERGEVIWAIPYQGEMPRGDPHSTMSISQWAPDSSALYFYYAWAYDGWYTLFNGYGLQVLDIETGQTESVVSGCCIAFSFSPDMSKIAYTAGGKIGIYESVTDEDRSVAIRSESIDQAGNIHWSPSGDGLVFTVLLDDSGNAREIYLDAQSWKQKVLVETFIEDYSFDGWSRTEGPRYKKVNRESGGEGVYEIVSIDIKTATVMVVGTPTPRP